jgi:hypothetical protein
MGIILSKTKKSVNPAEYGRWHEITEADTENCSPSKRGNRLSLVNIHHLEIEKGKSESDNDNQPIKTHKDNPSDNLTFSNDESLEGLDTIIKKLKEKAINNHVNEKNNSKGSSEKSTDEAYELDDIGKTVLEGLTNSEFLDQLEKELEDEADKLHNAKE